MRRWHFYVMGLLATVWGLVGAAEYLLVSFGLEAAWLEAYRPEQLRWLAAIPAWVHGVWGAQATLALVGALCLLAQLRASVWMLGLSFVLFVVLAIWAHVAAAPPIWAVADPAWSAAVTLLLVVLTALFWLYARGEKRRGEIL